MEIFLGAETEGPAAGKWFELQKQLSPLLAPIKNINYGDSLVSIGIISILMQENYFEDGGFKERKYYNRKTKEADIRLRLNYKDFLRSSPKDRREIYVNHILECIRVAGEMVDKDFKLSQLLSDVKRLLV